MSAESAERRRAERRLLSALRRASRGGGFIRTDALLRLVHAAEAADRRPPSHRGAAPLTLDDAQLREVLDGLVAQGTVRADGRRVRLAEPDADLDPLMAERVTHLLTVLVAANASPPRVDRVARRLGIPPHVIDKLRRDGTLVAIAPGIDYPRDVWVGIERRLGPLEVDGVLRVPHVRAELGVSRRLAAAIATAFAHSRC